MNKVIAVEFPALKLRNLTASGINVNHHWNL